MDTQKQVIDRLKQANNVLVTVSNDPSVDQLAACIGLTLALNKLDKHATAVFSGRVPSTIEFLQPEETIEKNTDSLRDFIISLDKSKADKLRYKVEDSVVRIFITPYRTSISDADLDFSQGDFNVDVVLAIGVQEQKELDQAVTAHGRILHDATVITVNNQEQSGELGSIHWLNTSASSLSEMAAVLATSLSQDILDEQISTALLTGVVAETDRFSNEKTTADTMNVSASLMAAGANQQLVANKLQEAPAEAQSGQQDQPVEKEAEAYVSEDGTLEINHDHDEKPEGEEEAAQPVEPGPTEVGEGPEPPQEEPAADTADAPQISPSKQTNTPPEPPSNYKNPRTAVSPPAFSSDTDPNAASKEEEYVDPLTLPTVDADAPILNHDMPGSLPSLDTPQAASHDRSQDTLQDIEKEVHSPHLAASSPQADSGSKPAHKTPGGPEELNLNDLQRPSGIDDASAEPAQSVDAARDAVAAAMSGSDQPLAPISALNAQPLGGPLHASTPPPAPSSDVTDPNVLLPFPGTPAPQPPAPNTAGPTALPTADQPVTMPLPGVPPSQPPTQDDSPQSPNAAPPVPPPIVPPFPQ